MVTFIVKKLNQQHKCLAIFTLVFQIHCLSNTQDKNSPAERTKILVYHCNSSNTVILLLNLFYQDISIYIASLRNIDMCR